MVLIQIQQKKKKSAALLLIVWTTSFWPHEPREVSAGAPHLCVLHILNATRLSVDELKQILLSVPLCVRICSMANSAGFDGSQ